MQAKVHYFIVPESDTFVSGGNLYNDHFIEYLVKEKEQVIRIPLEKWKIEFGQNDNAYVWLDSIYLDESDGLKPFPKNSHLLVHHLQSLFPPEGLNSEVYFEEKEREKLERFQKFLVTSHFTAEYLEQKGFDFDNIIICPPALGFIPFRKSITHKGIQCIMVANLVERKGVLPFLQGLAQSLKTSDEIQVRIYGESSFDPFYAKACFNFIENHPDLRQKVFIHETIDQNDLLQAYQASNLFVSASEMETYGMALQEAAAMGVPILSLDRGNCANHIKEGVNGYTHDHIGNLVEHIRNFLDNSDDFLALYQSAQNYRPSIMQSWDKVVQHFLRNF